MFDIVLNHCSAKLVQRLCRGDRTTPLLPSDGSGRLQRSCPPARLTTSLRHAPGKAHVWTTFSADQVDLNWQNPEVFFEFLDILLYLSKGMRVARLDAVASLKTLGRIVSIFRKHMRW